MSSRFSPRRDCRARWLLALGLAAKLGISAAANCNSRLQAEEFPGRLVIEVRNTEIGIGGVAPFEGGSGKIIASVGPLRDGVAELRVAPGAFQIEAFDFPYLLVDWRTELSAEDSGWGLIELPLGGEGGSVFLEIPLLASNAIGDVRMKTRFTTGKSPPVRIDDMDYDLEGELLDPITGAATLVTSGQIAARSHFWFRGDDYFARTDVCLRFDGETITQDGH